MKGIFRIFPLLCGVLLCGCVSYHPVSSMQNGFPGVSRYLVVLNRTKDASLTADIKRGFLEIVKTTPGLNVRPTADAVNVTLCLKDSSVRMRARTEVRDRDSRDHKSEAYQNVLSRLTLQVEYTVLSPDGTEKLRGVASGIGDVPYMPDYEQAYRNASRLAAEDAARQIAAAMRDVRNWKK